MKEFDFNNPLEDVEGINGVLMKILMSYIQVIGILGNIPARWPEEVNSTAKINDSVGVASSDALSLDCLFGELAGTMPQYYFQSLIVNLMPPIFMLMGFLFWIMWFIVKKLGLKNPSLWNSITATIIIIGFNQ